MVIQTAHSISLRGKILGLGWTRVDREGFVRYNVLVGRVGVVGCRVVMQMWSEKQGLTEKKVGDVMVEKRRLVEVPYTATLAHTLNALVANRVVAVPVAAPPGHWIGAGGSMIMESDKHTGVARKHYIGMVTMHYIGMDIGRSSGGSGGGGYGFDFEGMMSVPVSSLIGHCLEGLSMWTLHPSTGILERMEMFSKGIHRALVPIDGHMENISGVELVESASSYRMLTQMDVLRFVREHAPELNGVLSCTVGELGVIHDTVYGVGDATQVMDAIKCMQAAPLYAVPIIQASDATDGHTQLINGKGRKLIGTFSATDLRSCPVTQLQPRLHLGVMEFAEVSASPLHGSSTNSGGVSRELVTCFAESCLGEAIDMAVTKHVHRVWVVDRQGLLLGLVSLTDMIRAVRISLLPDPTVL